MDEAICQQMLEAQDKQTGFAVNAIDAPQKARELMIEQGIHPEDNTFSREIRHSRDGE